jgi:hypothetical protein
MASSYAYETHPVGGRVVKVVTPAGETSGPVFIPVAGALASMTSAGAGTGAIEITRSLPSEVIAGTAVWYPLIAATGTDGLQTIAGGTAIRLSAVTAAVTLEVCFAPIV